MGSTASIEKENMVVVESDTFVELSDAKLAFDVAYNKIPAVLRELAQLPSVSVRSNAITPALKFVNLYTRSSACGGELRELWVSKLARNGLVPVGLGLWPSLWNPDFLQVS